MLVVGAELLEAALADGRSLKAVLNEQGIVFFPVSQEHRASGAAGIWYADDYKGNALAAMITGGRIEIRYHRAFSDQRVAKLMRSLRDQPELTALGGLGVTYQGRAVAADERSRR